MAATRRLYKAMAKALSEVEPLESDGESAQRAWEEAVVSLADALKDDNASFRHDLFLKAAGHPDWSHFTD